MKRAEPSKKPEPVRELDDSFFRAAIENAGDLISVVDGQGRFVYLSPNVKRVFGFDGGDIAGLTDYFFHPDDYKAVLAEFMELVEQGGRRQLSDHRMRHLDGHWIWVQTHCTNLLDDPRVNGIVMVSRDITAQKQRDDEIRRAEISVKFGHWRWDKNAPGPVWSDGMFAMLGLKRSAMPADMTWTLDLFEPDDYAAMIEDVSQALTEGASFNRIVAMQHADGSYRRVMLMGHVERDNEGNPTTIVGICQDVTEIERANEAIKKSEQEFRLLAEHSTDAIARFNARGEVQYMSPSIERILGYTPEECVGILSEIFLHPDDMDPTINVITQMFEDRLVKRTQFRMKSKAGHYVWLEAALSPLIDTDGDLDGFVACSRDITAQKKHEQELMAARERAEQANLTKSRFLANMSHELRTPLNAILGFSEMMTEKVFGPLGSPQYEEYIGMIHESGTHLLSLISDILDMSKIEAGKYDLTIEPVNVADAITKASHMVDARLNEGELELRVENGAGEDVAVMADTRALTQMLLNLLSNAVKFTPAGGRITVAYNREGPDLVSISVTDTGVGIEAKDIERVLRPFEQVVTHAELASKGTGLGLPLVRAMVDIHDGEFAIESEPGKGTTVRIILPAAADNAMPRAASASA